MRLARHVIALALGRNATIARPVCRPLAVGCLALMLLGTARVGAAHMAPGALSSTRAYAHPTPMLSTARSMRTPTPPMAPAPAWRGFTYGGAAVRDAAGRVTTRIPGYSLAYPPRWSGRLWPDTLAGYGQLDLRSPAGSVLDVMLIPLRPRGPALTDVITHDRASLPYATQDSVALPLGTAVRLSSSATPGTAGGSIQILYLRRQTVVYRLFSSRPVGALDGASLVQVAATLRVLPGSGPFRTTIPAPPAPPQPPMELCCHCPAWGAGWGTALTSLDGVPVYWNAGDGDNGCVGTYGILYQCVELAQRYFAVRWGYPAMWSGVGAAADMRANHPDGIQFIPNGGSPGPQEGDALVFYGGGFGHVAVVKAVDSYNGRIDIVEENWSPTGEAALSLYADNTIGIRNSVYGSYTVAGWLHSPKNMLAAPATRA